jgi:hypothetical protein
MPCSSHAPALNYSKSTTYETSRYSALSSLQLPVSSLLDQVFLLSTCQSLLLAKYETPNFTPVESHKQNIQPDIFCWLSQTARRHIPTAEDCSLAWGLSCDCPVTQSSPVHLSDIRPYILFFSEPAPQKTLHSVSQTACWSSLRKDSPKSKALHNFTLPTPRNAAMLFTYPQMEFLFNFLPPPPKGAAVVHIV